MTDPIFTASNLFKSFGALQVCRDLSLSLQPGELHALIGPNGAGKTTALDIFTGLIIPDMGSILFQGREIVRLPVQKRARLGLARAFQITSVFNTFTVFENICLAVQAQCRPNYCFWQKASHEKRLTEPAEKVMEQMGLEERRFITAGNLSHGERRQLEMAMVLATNPVMLLLDEPMAGLGPGGTKKLSELIEELKGEVTILLVEHDMQAVFALADRITMLVQGQAEVCGTPDEIRSNSVVQAAYLGTG